MKIVNEAIVGTLESSDCMVTVAPSNVLSIEIDSIVIKQYGKVIESIARDIIEGFEISSGSFKIQDKGAMDFAIKARVETAIIRGVK